ncbi:MAG: glycosyltransferase family 4 protein [Candidatus Moranbacteria bacterium]|nr:glycosyltransferase family 4 protein [Candidatus Moranbacteria bacterium]
MKILVIAPTPFFSDRGTHIRILEEALALEKRGHSVTLATYHIGADLPKRLETNIDVRRIRRLLFWYKKLEAGPDWQKIILDLLLIKKVFFLARTKRPDVIHAHLHEGVAIGWIVQKLLFWRGIKLVGDFHGSLTKEMVSHDYLGAGFLKRVFQWIEARIDNMGDVAVTSSWENTQEISAIRKGKSTETLLDGVNDSWYQHLPSQSEARKQLGLPENKVIVTYTGALIPNKGIQYFLESIPLVLRSNPDVHFVIAGFPLDLIQPFFEGKNLSASITFISPLSYFELPKLLHASDIGVDPKDVSVRQASGKTLQYMGAGLPVACFDTKNNREYLGAEHEMAQDLSPSGLADAIVNLVNDPKKRKRFGEENRKRAFRFSWDVSAEKLETLLKTV